MRRASWMNAPRAADERPDRRRQAFRQAQLDRRHVARPVGDRTRCRDGGVEEPRAVEVDRQAVLGGDGGHLGEVPRRNDPAAAAVVRVLEANHAGPRVVVVVVVVGRQVDGRPQRIQRQRAVARGPDGAEHQASESRRPAVLVVIDVRFVAEDDVAASPAMCEQRGEVAHRAARHEDGGVLARHLRGQRLQAIDRRVVAEHVIANLGGRHGLTHGRRGNGDRITSQIDAHALQYARMGRLSSAGLFHVAICPTFVCRSASPACSPWPGPSPGRTSAHSGPRRRSCLQPSPFPPDRLASSRRRKASGRRRSSRSVSRGSAWASKGHRARPPSGIRRTTAWPSAPITSSRP